MMPESLLVEPKGGVFFTSIPKAGKNLVYSFLGELGMKRAPVAREAALRHTEAPWLKQFGKTCTYASPTLRSGSHADEAGFIQFAEAVSGLPARSVLHHHYPFVTELLAPIRAGAVSVVFLFRNPRDLLVSMADYIRTQHKPAHLANRFATFERNELVARLWSGDDELVSLPDYFAMFQPWRGLAGVLTLRFEDLIGQRGSGSQEAQTKTLRQLATVFPEVGESAFHHAQDRTFNPKAGTFFKGQIGRWREESDPKIKHILNSSKMSQLAEEWGYHT